MEENKKNNMKDEINDKVTDSVTDNTENEEALNETVLTEGDNENIGEENTSEKDVISSGRKTRRNILIAFGGLFLLGVVCALLLNALDNGWFTSKKDMQEYDTKKPNKIVFHETYPEAFNIFEYDEYLELNRNVYYTDERMGTTTVVEENDIKRYGEAFVVLYNMIKYATEGDWEKYNAILSDELAKDAGEFTQQQIYKVEITPFRSANLEGENGKTYNVTVFKISYMIHENNGTFRDDIGSDMARLQYYTFSNESGEYRLITIANQNYK